MTTLSDMSAKKKPEPSAEEIAAKEWVRLAKEQGLSLTGPEAPVVLRRGAAGAGPVRGCGLVHVGSAGPVPAHLAAGQA